MIRMRKEAKAQGLTSVKVWACSLACYTRAMLAQGGADVEGTYFWMQFLPFEEANLNPEATNYVNGVGANKVDSFGAQAWQAAVAFDQVGQPDRGQERAERHHPLGHPDRAEGRDGLHRQRVDGREEPPRLLSLLRHHADPERQVRPGRTRPSRARSTATPAT